MPYELVKVDLSEQTSRTPAHLALHPFGEVPVLVDGEVTLFESSAICLYLADRFPERGLAPPLGSPDRGPYLQWLLFAEVELDPVVLELYRDAQRPEAQRPDRSKQHRRLGEVLDVLDGRLGDREFAAGNSFTAADVVLASVLHWANTLELLDGRRRLFDSVMRHSRRPATRRAVSS